MGRGRQKAKQRKVARDLKYFTPDTDYQALERELKATQHSDDAGDSDYSDYDEYEVPPATDDWDEDDWKPSR